MVMKLDLPDGLEAIQGVLKQPNPLWESRACLNNEGPRVGVLHIFAFVSFSSSSDGRTAFLRGECVVDALADNFEKGGNRDQIQH